MLNNGYLYPNISNDSDGIAINNGYLYPSIDYSGTPEPIPDPRVWITMATRFKFRRDLESALIANNPRLMDGEPCISTDSNILKIGGGDIRWNDEPKYEGIYPTRLILFASDWSSLTQTVNFLLGRGNKHIIANPIGLEAMICKVRCTSKNGDLITFTASQLPSEDIEVDVVCLG